MLLNFSNSQAIIAQFSEGLMIDSPFPETVAFAAVREADMEGVHLHPEEEALCAAWRAEARRLQFRMGRLAAHRALQQLGLDGDLPVRRGSHGEPLWPPGTVGSIANTKGMAIAAAARIEDARSLGIDIESLSRPLRTDIAGFICTDTEREALGDDETSLRRIFCAKEALYKALFPLCGHYIGFKDIELQWSATDQQWSVRPRATVAAAIDWAALRISAREAEGYLVSSLLIPAGSASRK